jgi:hypothetical protein
MLLFSPCSGSSCWDIRFIGAIRKSMPFSSIFLSRDMHI